MSVVSHGQTCQRNRCVFVVLSYIGLDQKDEVSSPRKVRENKKYPQVFYLSGLKSFIWTALFLTVKSHKVKWKSAFVIRNPIVICKINVASPWYHQGSPAVLLSSKVVPFSQWYCIGKQQWFMLLLYSPSQECVPGGAVWPLIKYLHSEPNSFRMLYSTK